MGFKKNRIALILLAVLIIAGAATLISFSSGVYATADELILTQAVSEGDAKAANGLKLSVDLVAQACLSWNGTISFNDDKADMDLKHSYHYDADYYSVWRDENLGYQLKDQNGIYIYADPMQNEALKRHFDEIAASMVIGAGQRVTVHLSEFMDYYPICVRYYFSDGSGLDTGQNDSQEALHISSCLTELFRYPASDEPSEFYIYRNPGPADSKTGYSVDVIYTEGVTEEAPLASGICIYDAFYLYDYEENTSGSFAGNGLKIYRIPWEEKTVSGENYSWTNKFIETDEIREVCSLDPGFIMQEAFVTEDEKGILFFGHDDTDFMAYYLDLEKEVLQKKTICEVKTQDQPQGYIGHDIFDKHDDHYIVLTDHVFYAFYPDASGKYAVMSFPEDSGSDYLSLMYASQLWYYLNKACFDGQRLAVAGLINRDNDVRLAVAVYSAEGVQYYAEYEISVLKSRHVKGCYQYSRVKPEWISGRK